MLNKKMALNSSLNISDFIIGKTHPTFIIAEMSGNHGHDFEKAKNIIYAAKEAGANAVKLQTYTPDTITIDTKTPPFFIKEGPWKGQYLYDLYQKGYTPWEWFTDLQKIANNIGIILFSSPFDNSAVDFLEEHNCPLYKIASPEIIDLPLIERAAKTGKPMIISTGSATLSDIHIAVETALSAGTRDIALLKCTSTYPAPPDTINLATIPHMQQSFNCPVGLSDHTLGIGVPIASIAVGASIIEKHFILDRNDNSVDNFFSATPNEFKMMVDGIRTAEAAIGNVYYPIHTPRPQKSIIVVNDIKAGDVLNKDNIKCLRPGGGLEPKYYKTVMKRKAIIDLKKGTLLNWDMLGELT